jgi:hypothetical protein
VTANATQRVAAEWRARIAAEYASAAVTQHFVLWLMQAGAPPDLIDAGLVIVSDELVHSRSSHEVYVAAGGTEPPAIVQTALELKRSSPRIEEDILSVVVRVFCLGETVAVPLFRHLREGCTEPVARAALDRILRDEVRHRDFGWDVLDWLLVSAIGPEVPARVERELPGMMRMLEGSYGLGNEVVARDDGAMTDVERSWGLAPPRDYAEILARTVEREWVPRFGGRGVRVL